MARSRALDASDEMRSEADVRRAAVGRPDRATLSEAQSGLASSDLTSPFDIRKDIGGAPLITNRLTCPRGAHALVSPSKMHL